MKMTTVQKLCSVLIFGLASGFVGLGCAAPTGDDTDAMEQTAAAVEDEAITSDASELTSCPGGFGAPVPVAYDDAFIACVPACMAGNHTYATCRRTCCIQYTGCAACYQQ